MELFRLYMKQRVRGIVLLILFGVVFDLSFLLYHLPMKALVYPTLLCIFLGIVFLLTDVYRVRNRHIHLMEINRRTAAMMDAFPKAQSIEDKDYQDIIRALQEEMAGLETASGTAYRNMMDYYTLWVHQIKTPIASMKLNIQKEDTPLARKLSSELLRIEQYVEMVLAYLRLDSDSGDYVFKEHGVDTLIKQSVKRFATEFITRKIRLEYQPVTETVITDDKWFSFVLEQLISNALKYTGEGGCVKIYMTEPKTLCIEDTGIGIATEDLPRIFEKGYTGYNGRADRCASGIGLYLCRRICKNLSAEISAVSEPGRGTTVRINLEQYQLKVE